MLQALSGIYGRCERPAMLRLTDTLNPRPRRQFVGQGAWREREDMPRTATTAGRISPKKTKPTAPKKAKRTATNKAKPTAPKRVTRALPKRGTRAAPNKQTSVAVMQARIDALEAELRQERDR